MNYWESPDGKRSAADLHRERLPAGDRRDDRQVHPSFGDDGAVDLRDGLGRDPKTIRVQSGTPGKVFEDLDSAGSAPGEAYFSPRAILRAYNVDHRQARLAVSHRAASRRVRLRHVAEGRLAIHRRARTPGARSPSMPRAASPTSRPGRPRSITTAPTASARICSPTVCSRSTPGPASGCGTSRRAPRPLGLRQRRGAAVDDHHEGRARRSTSSRWPARPAISTSSTG